MGDAPVELAHPVRTDAQFNNADRVRVLANMPPIRMIWVGLGLMALGYFIGPQLLVVLSGAVFFVGIVFNDIKGPS